MFHKSVGGSVHSCNSYCGKQHNRPKSLGPPLSCEDLALPCPGPVTDNHYLLEPTLTPLG